MINKQTILLSLLLVFLGASCVDDDDVACTDPTNEECPNFDPCTQVIAADSDFRIVGVIQPGLADTIAEFEVDTAYGTHRIEYKANVENLSSYRWRVGADPRTWTEPELFLSFVGYSGPVSVTLETTAEDTLDCLTEEELADSQTKTVFYQGTESFETGAVIGTFKGFVEGEENTEFEVNIVREPLRTSLFGIPLPDNCSYERGIRVFNDYQYFVSTHSGIPSSRCRNVIVIGQISLGDRDEITITYTYDDDAGGRKKVIFTGRRQ